MVLGAFMPIVVVIVSALLVEVGNIGL